MTDRRCPPFFVEQTQCSYLGEACRRSVSCSPVMDQDGIPAGTLIIPIPGPRTHHTSRC